MERPDAARPTREEVREWFPGLQSSEVLLDNAGGSQVPRTVADRIRDYLLHSYVQVGADYATSRRSTETVHRAHRLVKVLMNAEGRGEVVLGPSTSALCAMLASCYGRSPCEGRDEIVVGEAGHEANMAPWFRLKERGYRVRIWKIHQETQEASLQELERLIGPRTRVLAVHHVSNLLGRIENLGAVTELAHRAGARVVVDGVALAPHRAMDVAAWDVDWYVFSTYKVYGPHLAALFGTHEAFAELEGPNFFFIDRRDLPYKFELGGVCHEGCAGLLGLRPYLAFLAGHQEGEDLTRPMVVRAFEYMAALEVPLQEQLLAYLRSKAGVRIIGPSHPAPSRVPTISFVRDGRTSREIAQAANARGLGIRHGHFYAHRLVSALGLDPPDGVVRVSLVHYNHPEELAHLTEVLDRVL